MLNRVKNASAAVRAGARTFGTRTRNVVRTVATGGGGIGDRVRRGFAAARGAEAYPNA